MLMDRLFLKRGEGMEIIIAFNGEEQLKRALLEKIQPEIIEKYRSQITLKIFDPIFGVRVVKTLEAFKCLCLFHGFTPSFKYLADVVGWGLPEHEASVWPSELILAIKPGIF